MTLRPEVIRQRLRKLREVLRNLHDVRGADRSEFTESYRHYWLAERGLQLAAETIFDVGTHILASVFNEHPDDYEEIPEALARHDVIDEHLEERLAGLGGFRNVLVHGYLDVDREVVWDVLQNRLGDFADFADQTESFLDRRDD